MPHRNSASAVRNIQIRLLQLVGHMEVTRDDYDAINTIWEIYLLHKDVGSFSTKQLETIQILHEKYFTSL